MQLRVATDLVAACGRGKKTQAEQAARCARPSSPPKGVNCGACSRAELRTFVSVADVVGCG